MHLMEGMEKAFIAEILSLRELKHPHILTFETFFEEPQLCVVTRWMDKGALNEVLQREGTSFVPWERSRRWALEISMGLEFLHAKNVIHRDLKSLNIFIGNKDDAVIADFGFAKFVDSASVQVATAGVQVGTYFWMAPEMMEHAQFSAASDMYAFGIIVWEMMACKLPYQSFKVLLQLQKAVLRGERPPLDPAWPHECQSLMTNCWANDPLQRWTAVQVVQFLGKEHTAGKAQTAFTESMLCPSPSTCSESILSPSSKGTAVPPRARLSFGSARSPPATSQSPKLSLASAPSVPAKPKKKFAWKLGTASLSAKSFPK